MVRRRTKRKTRRKKQGISVIGTAETYLLLNVATQTLFRTNPYQFIVGDASNMYASGTSSMSLKELFRDNQHSSGADAYTTMNVIKKNFKAQWLNGAIQMALIPMGFKFAKGLARPAISRTNRLLNKSGIGSTVKL
jgi:hypothetical protein